MALKKEPPQAENHERWLVSYADFITLLFAFFVVMFASSQTDKTRAKQISQAVEKALENGNSVGVPPAVAKILGGTVDDKGQGNAMMKGPGGAQHSAKETPPDNVVELLPSMQRLDKELEDEIKTGKLEMKLEARGLVISLKQSAFFPSGQDALDQKNLPILKKVADVIRVLPNFIQLEGHTDAVPIHNAHFKSNWELSCARAIAVMEAFSDTFNLKRERFSVVGRADTSPLDTNETPEGRARNRRVDVIIVNSPRLTEPAASAMPVSAAATGATPTAKPNPLK
jgi:chemotaxis protein MotB